ncbi:MAG: AsmA-like C-terminal region-containing protein [Hyphomicrobiales bacterium]|nr:AsmA-like C-terminal region-containing protein [Hyphomicrobiales bacterium]
MDDLDSEPNAAAPCPAGPGLARRCGRFVLWTCGGGGLVAIALALGLAVALTRGPLELDAAARAAESALAELGGPGAVAHVDRAGLDWSWTEGLSVTLSDIAVERDAGLSLTTPRIATRLRLLPLLIGRVRPRVVAIDAPRIVLDTGELHERPDTPAAPLPDERPAAAAPAEPSSPAAAPPVSTRLAEAADVAIERALVLAREQGVDAITLRGGAIDLTHRGADGAIRHIAFADLEVDAVVDGPGGEFDAGLSARGDVGRWSMRLTRRGRDDGGHRLTFSADDVTVPDLVGSLGPTMRLDIPFYPRLDLAFDAVGRFDGADFDLRLGAGRFRFGKMREDEILFDEAGVKAHWNPRDRLFVVEHAGAAIGETRWNLHGRVVPPPTPGGVWAWEATLDEGLLKPRDVAGPAVPLKGGAANGTFDATTSFLDVALAEVRFGEATLRSAGRLDLSGPEPRFTYDLQFSPLTVAEVAHGWPHWVASEARTWFVANVHAGRLPDLRIQLKMPRFDHPETWPGDAMRISSRFEGVRFDPLGRLPAVAGADGRLSVDDRRFEAVFDKARAATKGKEPTIEGFRFSVADMFVKPPRGAVRLRVAGDIAALAEIVDAEPLAALSQAGIGATGLSGAGVVDAKVDVVFTDPVDAKSIDYRIEANLDGFSSQQPIQGRKFQDAKFKVVVDPRGLDVSGRAVVDGVPTDVHVYDPAGATKTNEKRDFKMEVDDATRQRLGLDFGTMVEGAVGLSVSQPDPNQLRSRIEADLGPVRLDFAALGWTKGPGVPAKAAFDLWDDDKGLHVDNLAVDSEGLSIRGSLLLDKDRNLIAADLPRFQLRKGDAAKVKVSRAADKALTIAFEATSFDVRGLLHTSRRPPASGEAAASPDLILKLKAHALQGFGDVVLSDVTVDGRWRAGAFQTLELRGRSGPRRPLSVAVRPEGGHRRFTAVAEDAGAALRFLDLFDRVDGGKLTLSARLGEPGSSEGTLRLVDFHLLEEPRSGRGVASETTADGGRRVLIRRAEIDRSTNFDRAQVRFAMHDGIIDVAEGIAKGASVGATATGQIDVVARRLSLSGTYIPAFGLNNLAGRIPILGTIAGSGSNEGLVGVTFRVGGPIEDPILEINPLSAVAPGIFRRIFEFQRDERPQSSGDPNAPTSILPETGPTRITP